MVFDEEYGVKRTSFTLKSLSTVRSSDKQTYDLSIFDKPRVSLKREQPVAKGGITLEGTRPDQREIQIGGTDADQFTVDKDYYE